MQEKYIQAVSITYVNDEIRGKNCTEYISNNQSNIFTNSKTYLRHVAGIATTAIATCNRVDADTF